MTVIKVELWRQTKFIDSIQLDICLGISKMVTKNSLSTKSFSYLLT